MKSHVPGVAEVLRGFASRSYVCLQYGFVLFLISLPRSGRPSQARVSFVLLSPLPFLLTPRTDWVEMQTPQEIERECLALQKTPRTCYSSPFHRLLSTLLRLMLASISHSQQPMSRPVFILTTDIPVHIMYSRIPYTHYYVTYIEPFADYNSIQFFLMLNFLGFADSRFVRILS